MGDNGLIILLLKEPLKAQLDLRLHRHMTAEFGGISSLQKNVIFLIILIHKGVDV